MKSPSWKGVLLRVGMPVILSVCLFILPIYFSVLPKISDVLLQEKRNSLIDLADVGVSILNNFHTKAENGVMNLAEAQSKAIETLRQIRYEAQDSGGNYFVLLQFDPEKCNEDFCNHINMLMHPIRPQLELGVNFAKTVDAKGRFYAIEVVQKALRDARLGTVDGFVNFVGFERGEKTTNQNKRTVPKTSFGRYFEPWQLVVITGIYLPEIDPEIKRISIEILDDYAIVFILVLFVSGFIVWQGRQSDKQRQLAQDELTIAYSNLEHQVKKRTEELNFQKHALDEHAIVSITDVKGNITYANDKLCEINEYSRDELIGQNHRILKSGEHPDEYYADLWKTVANGDIWRGNIKSKKKSGDFYWAAATIVPFMDENGKPFQYISIRTDITKQISAEHSAEQANQAKSDFLSSMSHELRTPMNAILGFSQLLGTNPDEPLSEEQKIYVDHIMKGGKHLLDLIKDVLDLASIEAGKVELSLEDIDSNKVLEDCLFLTTGMAKDRGIDISVPDTEPDVLMVKADYTRFKQVLLNLMSNAIKYNSDKGKVAITFTPTDSDRMRIAVFDTGMGIAKDRQGELFQPFSRLDAANSEIEGTGIGLVVCKNLVELMGGIIGFDSEEGKGSTFWFDLPLADRQPFKEDMLEALDGDDVTGPFETIEGSLLYVEDNSSNLQLMEMIVSRIDGLSLISATTAELGIEIARNKLPDLIILDINLPGMSGLDAIKELKKYDKTKNIPTLAVSAAATKSDIKKGMEAGFERYIIKPINIEEVTEAIREALKG